MTQHTSEDPGIEHLNYYGSLNPHEPDSDATSEISEQGDIRSGDFLSTGGPALPHNDSQAAEIQRLLSQMTPNEIRKLRASIQTDRGDRQHPLEAAASDASAVPDGTGDEPAELHRCLEQDFHEEATAQETIQIQETPIPVESPGHSQTQALN